MKKKKKKKSPRAKLTDKLDELCKQIIRERDDHRCQKCGKPVSGSDAHGSHVVPKGNGASKRRFDLINMKLLCMYDHLHWWHKNPTEAGKWFALKFHARDEYLEKYRYGKTAKITTAEMEDLVVVYEEKLKELLAEKQSEKH